MSLSERLEDLKRRSLLQKEGEKTLSLEKSKQEQLDRQKAKAEKTALENKARRLLTPFLDVVNNEWLGGRGKVFISSGQADLRWDQSKQQYYHDGDLQYRSLGLSVNESDEIKAGWREPIQLSDPDWKDKVEEYIIHVLETGDTEVRHHEPPGPR